MVIITKNGNLNEQVKESRKIGKCVGLKFKLNFFIAYVMQQSVIRCWNSANPLLLKYHDEEWGVPLHDDRKLFELLTLEMFQSGLNWELILKRREGFRKAFGSFDPVKVSNYSDKEIERLVNNPEVIRNRAKIVSTINNARCFLKVQNEFGSFDAFIWRFVGGKPIQHSYASFSQMPAETPDSKTMSAELKKLGFKFVGPTVCYAFMQAAGLVNDHLTSCFRYKRLKKD
jgi:DNA-3-methyladenine glycosylase I